MDQDVPSATLRLGGRLSIVAGLLIWVAAAVMFFTPVWVETKDATRVDCGSAASPKLDGFNALLCGPEAERNRLLGLALIGAGLLVGIGGAAAFGLRAPSGAGRQGE